MSVTVATADRISVCIPTFRRKDRLAALIQDLAAQTRCPDEVVVVDNDAAQSARETIEQLRAKTLPFALIYGCQPERNIARTRNMTVALATGDWLAFIDDDERAPATWLQQMVDAARNYGASGVLAPVLPVVPPDAPAWIRRGSLYDFPRLPTGTVVPLNRMLIGNALLNGPVLRSLVGPFNEAYGLAGGEDGDVLIRFVEAGGRVIWCDEATVTEPVDASRLSLKWLIRRSYSGGQEYARKRLDGRYGRIGMVGRVELGVRATLQMVAAFVLSLLACVRGRHHAARWLMKAAANFGKLSAFWGGRYRFYRGAA